MLTVNETCDLGLVASCNIIWRPFFVSTFDHIIFNLQDAEAYAHLLNVLAPEHSNPSTLVVKVSLQRAKLVLEHADRMGCKRYLTSKDIVDGSPNLNLAFVAHIFQHRNGLSTF